MSPKPIYGIDDRPPAGEAVALGVQHLLAMLLGNITPPLLVAGALGLDRPTTALLVQMGLLMAGVATLVQSYPLGRVGGRLPIMMGTSIAFVAGVIEIGNRWGLAAVFGACLTAAAAEIVLALWFTRVRRFFPPLVTGVVVVLIGLTLIPVGMDYAAGGPGASDYGSPLNLGIAAIVFLITLLLNRCARGLLSHASMLAGVLVGYAVALGLGKVRLDGVAEAGWIALPTPLAFGIELHPSAILLMAFLYVVSTMETVGDIYGTVAVDDREPTDRELQGGLLADGVLSALAALFSALPNTSYSQNVGLVNFTGVASRHVTAVGGGCLVLLGLVPKVGALFATVPPAVIGGGGLIMFSMIFASGAAILHRGVELGRREMVILAVAVGLGLGVELRPQALAQLPETIRTFCGSGLATGGLVALVLNRLFPAAAREER